MVRQRRNRYKLNLKYLSREEKLLFTRQVISSLTNNPYFPVLPILIPELTAAVHQIEACLDRTSASLRDDLNDKDRQEGDMVKLERLLITLAEHIYKACRGDEEKLRSASLWLKTNGTPESIPAAPQNLMVAGVSDSEIAITWNAVTRAKSYVIQHTTDLKGLNNWDLTLVSNKSKAQIKSLKNGTKYWFRVAAIGATGQGPWSAPATKYPL